MILNTQSGSIVPFLTEAICLGDKPIQKLYLGTELLYDNSSVTTAIVDKFMKAPLTKGQPSQINKFASYVSGKVQALPATITVDDNGTSRVCTLDPDCKVVGLGLKSEDAPYSITGQAHVYGGSILLNEMADSAAPMCMICQLQQKGNKWVYTPLEAGSFEPTGTDHPQGTYSEGSYHRHLNIHKNGTKIAAGTSKSISADTQRSIAYQNLHYPNTDDNLGSRWYVTAGTTTSGFDADTRSYIPIRIKDFCDKVLSGTVTIPKTDGTMGEDTYTSSPTGTYKIFIHYEKEPNDTATYTLCNSAGTKVFDALLCDCSFGKDFDTNPTQEEGSNPKVIKGRVSKILEGGKEVGYPLIDYRGSSSNNCLSFIYNLIPGKSYTYQLAAGGTGTFTMGGNMRLITLPNRNKAVTSGQQIYNVRDIGGTYGTDINPVHINYDVLYRGSDLVVSTDSGYQMTNADIRSYLRDANKLNIYTEVRLNEPWKHSSTYVYPMSIRVTDANVNTVSGGPTEVPLHEMWVPGTIEAWKDPTTLSNGAKGRVAFVFNSIATALDEGHKVYYHCIAGADRTGMITTLLLGLCGVPEKDLYRQFELTNFSGAGYTRAYYTSYNVSPTCCEAYINYIDQNFTGSNLAAKIENFLINHIGVTQASIDIIKGALIAN